MTVCDSDIKELKRELKRSGRENVICAVDLMSKYGFRVGIFENMKVNYENGIWTSISKGSDLKGKFLKSELKRIKESGILKLSKSQITHVIRKYTQKLYDKGIIGCPFSCHDLRHYYITKKGKDMNIKDFIQFSRGIHKNVSTTLGYMNV